MNFENEVFELKEKIKRLEKHKGLDVVCESCLDLRIENDTLTSKLAKFENSTRYLNEILGNHRSSNDKKVLGFTKCKASTSKVKQVNFVKKAIKNVSDGMNLADPSKRDSTRLTQAVNSSLTHPHLLERILYL
ncbi:hypothetical protein Tco_0499588 [Tanacetum coccineum]